MSGRANMIRRIRSHGEVNGVRFVVAEFALVAAVAVSIGVIYASRGEMLYAGAAIGVTANCLVVVGLGAQAWRQGRMGSPLRLLFNRAHRLSLAEDHPRMAADTLIIALTTIAPVVLAATVTYNALRRSPSLPPVSQ
ncbi:MAG: hypothetical protein ACRENM_08360 [Candidatus Dormibacteraceae bacterium]